MTPTTEAGRRFLEVRHAANLVEATAFILAIEREAVANALSEERIAAALDRYWSDRYGDLNGSERTSNRNVAAALRAALLGSHHD